MKTFFEKSLSTRDIIVRQDDDTSTFLEKNVGVIYPLIRIKDTVIDFTDIVSLNLTIGESFLPQLDVTIDDTLFLFRETDFCEKLDYVTLFVGCSNDKVYKPIKSDFLILEATSNNGSSLISFRCQMHFANLYYSVNRGENNTSFELLKSVAKECGMGFVSNVDKTNDKMFWIQSENNIDFIKHLYEHAYISDESIIRCFVDQYGNLNLIDVNKALKGTNDTFIETNPLTGEDIETTKVVLTSNRLSTDNNGLQINSYTPLNNFAQQSLHRDENFKLTFIKENDLNQNVSRDVNSDVAQLNESSSFNYVSNDNCHDNYFSTAYISKHNEYKLQGTKLKILLENYIPCLYMFMNVNVDIFNIEKRGISDSQDINTNVDNLSESKPRNNGNSHTLNENLSGENLLYKMEIEYNRGRSKNKIYKVRQKIFTFKK